nr:MAG TPA: hypothetical protein [Caudoviricetes sp.]
MFANLDRLVVIYPVAFSWVCITEIVRVIVGLGVCAF